MMFKPQYVDYIEASQIVAERVGLRPGGANPLDAAIAEGAIEAQIKVRGEWTVPPAGKKWRIREESLYSGIGSRDGRYWAEVSSGEIRFRTDDLDQLWPSGETPAAAPTIDGRYISPFIALMLEAVEVHRISEHSWPKREVLEKFFTRQKLPDGTPVSLSLAKSMAMLCRPLAAMRGGQKRLW